MQNKYSISIFWSDEDEEFIALSPEFPGLSAFGETHAEAVKEAEEAIMGMASLYKEEDEALPAPKKLPEHSGQYRIRIPRSLHTALVLEAERQGVSLNTLTGSYLSQAIAETTTLAAIKNELNDLRNIVEKACLDIHEMKNRDVGEFFTNGFSFGLKIATKQHSRKILGVSPTIELKTVNTYESNPF